MYVRREIKREFIRSLNLFEPTVGTDWHESSRVETIAPCDITLLYTIRLYIIHTLVASLVTQKPLIYDSGTHTGYKLTI